jgi:hypothetical protein
VKTYASSWRLLRLYLNLATLLLVGLGTLEHDCLEVMNEVFLSWPDLTDQPMSSPDIEYFTDGSSFVQDSTYHH